jgi:hypothetical protein
LAFLAINNVFYISTSKKDPEESNLEKEGPGNVLPIPLSNDQETPCSERHKHKGRGEVVHHPTRKLFP